MDGTATFFTFCTCNTIGPSTCRVQVLLHIPDTGHRYQILGSFPGLHSAIVANTFVCMGGGGGGGVLGNEANQNIAM